MGRTNEKACLDTLLILFNNGSLVLITLLILITSLTQKLKFLQLNVSKVNTADTVERFSQVMVTAPGKIYISQPEGSLRYLAPRDFVDPPHAILFFLCAIIAVVFFWGTSRIKSLLQEKSIWGYQLPLCYYWRFSSLIFGDTTGLMNK
jgi:hypothetical protein